MVQIFQIGLDILCIGMHMTDSCLSLYLAQCTKVLISFPSLKIRHNSQGLLLQWFEHSLFHTTPVTKIYLYFIALNLCLKEDINPRGPKFQKPFQMIFFDKPTSNVIGIILVFKKTAINWPDQPFSAFYNRFLTLKKSNFQFSFKFSLFLIVKKIFKIGHIFAN